LLLLRYTDKVYKSGVDDEISFLDLNRDSNFESLVYKVSRMKDDNSCDQMKTEMFLD